MALRPQTGEVLALVGGRDYGETPVRPLHAGAAPGRERLQALRLRRGARAHRAAAPIITLASWLDDSAALDADAVGALAPGQLRPRVPRPRRRAAEALAQLAQRRDRAARPAGRARSASPRSRAGSASRARCPRCRASRSARPTWRRSSWRVAYATLASGGVRPAIRAFEDIVRRRRARAWSAQPIRSERVLDPGTAFLVTQLLEGVVDRGTGRAVRAAGVARSGRGQDRARRTTRTTPGSRASRRTSRSSCGSASTSRRASGSLQPRGAPHLDPIREGRDGRRHPGPLRAAPARSSSWTSTRRPAPSRWPTARGGKRSGSCAARAAGDVPGLRRRLPGRLRSRARGSGRATSHRRAPDLVPAALRDRRLSRFASVRPRCRRSTASFSARS